LTKRTLWFLLHFKLDQGGFDGRAIVEQNLAVHLRWGFDRALLDDSYLQDVAQRGRLQDQEKRVVGRAVVARGDALGIGEIDDPRSLGRQGSRRGKRGRAEQQQAAEQLNAFLQTQHLRFPRATHSPS